MKYKVGQKVYHTYLKKYGTITEITEDFTITIFYDEFYSQKMSSGTFSEFEKKGVYTVTE